jgi:Domain of unknown function (DUF4404)
MDKNAIDERLAKLHAELQSAHEQNPATRERLGEVLPDIKRLTENGAGDASLPDRLEKVAVQFEADHPQLAGSVRRLVDLLAEVGI